MSITIGSNFKRIIEAKRLALKNISKDTGVPNSTLAGWLNNRTPKNPTQVKKGRQVFGRKPALSVVWRRGFRRTIAQNSERRFFQWNV